MMLDNIIIGTPLVSLDSLGVLDDEETISFSFDDVRNEKEKVFLPAILVKVGLFKSVSQIRNINKQRMTSTKIKDPLSKNLVREIEEPEMTFFKIGKNVFWLIVGE